MCFPMQLATELLLHVLTLILCALTVTLSVYSPFSGQQKLQQLDDIKKISILKQWNRD